MLLYLSSNENLTLFDFLKEEEGMLIEKLSGEFYLKRFIVHDMRTFSHYRYMIIDLSIIKDPIDDIIEALKALKIMYDVRIILLAGKTSIDFLNKIIDEANIYNIIFKRMLSKIKKQANVCLSEKGMTKHYVKININLNYDENEGVETTFKLSSSNLLNKDKQIIENKFTENKYTENKFDINDENIKIIIAGSMPRVGTTTTAMNMANYLSSVGAKVSYTEGNKSNHLSSIHSYFFFNNPIANNYFTDNDVDYYFNGNIPAEGYNFNIIDIGVLNSQNLKLLEELGDMKLLCGGTKPYEIEEIKKVLEFANDKDVKLILPEGSVLNIEQVNLPIKNEQIYYTQYSLNLFDGNINAKVFESILYKYTNKFQIDRAI